MPPAIHTPSALTAVELKGLDHIALSVADPEAMTAFLCGHVGMCTVAGGRDVTVLGAREERCAKLVLTPADGPRERGVLQRLVLRVSDLRRAVAMLPDGTDVHEEAPDLVTFDGPEGLGLGFALVAGGGIDYDIDHLVLQVPDREDTRVALAELGFVPRGEALHVRDKRIILADGGAATERPLLHHIAVHVDSTAAIETPARARGLRIVKDAPAGTFAILLPTRTAIRLDFVEAGGGPEEPRS